ncbi:hypothetical protein JW960_19775 [candidate division KSB1 bacterium]|nr:hypothetical protein [candidate division KSB1 bacterium]
MVQRVWLCLIILIVVLGSTTVEAKELLTKKDGSEEMVNGVDSKTMNVFMKQIDIYGRLAKPQTVFIIPGTDPRVDGIRIERYFYRDIFRTVEKSTLRKEKLKTQRQKDHILW